MEKSSSNVSNSAFGHPFRKTSVTVNNYREVKKLSKDTVQVQKHCLKLLYPNFSYSKALNKSGLDRLDYCRDLITKNLFREIKEPKHPLH